MTVYISMLRGINVSGHHLIKMDALRKSYESLGFSDIKTHLQSGNVVFAADEAEPRELARVIYERIAADFGFDVPVLVLPADKLAQIINGNPLAKDPDKDNAFLHVTFLDETPGQYDHLAIENKIAEGEKIVIKENAVYLYCPHGYGSTKLNNGFLESKLKVLATTRNWKTTNALLELARHDEQRPPDAFSPAKAAFLFFALLFTFPAFSQWVRLNTIAPVIDFTSLQFLNNDTGYAVGFAGRIIGTRNGGSVWSNLPSASNFDLIAVHLPTPGTGFAVGGV